MNWKRAMAIVLAAISALAASSLWYIPILFGRQFLALSGVAAAAQPVAWKIAVELLRNVLLASIISVLFSRLAGRRFGGALAFVMILWLGFPFTLLSGSVLWQNMPPELALIHGSDWLVKILLMTLIPWFAHGKIEAQVALPAGSAVPSN